MALNYGGVKIAPLKGKRFDSAVRMDGKEWSEFIEHVCKCIDRLRTIPTGRKILDQIRTSNHTCTIFSAGELWEDPNVASKWPPSLATDIAACVVPFRPRHMNITTSQKSNPSFVQQLKSNLQKIGELKGRKDVARELLEILERSKAKFSNPLIDVPRLVGITTQDLLEMCLGNKLIDDRTYYLLSFHLYEFLTPGPGCSSVVRFSPYDVMVRWCEEYEEGFSSAGMFETVKRRQRDRMAVILGHELIHSWRMMKGRRLVTGGWEEEGMTAGVGPFLPWLITENQLRKELGLPLRVKYAASGACSDMMTTAALYLSSPSYNYQIPETFRRENSFPERF